MKTLILKILYFVTICQCIEGYRYVVTTYTGDRFGAGTDARVFIKLFGSKGETRERELEAAGRDNFERGQLDTFLLDTKNVGTIKKAKIRHDNSWLGPGWFLEKVTVTDENGDYYDFPVHQWLDKHQNDGKTSRDITPKEIQRKQKKDEIEAGFEPRQPLDCSWPQGLGNGKLDDNHITASTSFNDLHLPYHSRLATIAPNSLGGWCPYKDDRDQYLQIDLGTVKKISGVATQGLGLVDEWTTSYRMLYANKSDEEFKEYSENGNFPKHFLGNDDQNGTVLHWLKLPFYSRFVRLSPYKWHGKGCLRAELYGCPTGRERHLDDEEDKDYIQVPEEHHQMNEDSTSLETSSNTEHHQEENEIHHDGNPDEVSTLEGRSHHRTEEDTGHKYENIPTKLVTERTKPHFPREDEKEHKMIQTENNYDPISAIDVIPIVHLDFDEIKDKTIPDVSGHHNDAHLRLPVDLRMFSKSCERGVRMNGGDIYFDGEFFIDKPRSEVTIAVWIKLFSNGGQHSIFNTIGGKHSYRKEGQYHFEVDRGRLRWFHRNEVGEGTFNVTSPLVIPAHTWTHIAATYSSATGKAAVYVNAKQEAVGSGTGILSQDWTARAGIGQHKGKRVLNGEIDEFYIFNKALSVKKIQMLMKKCSFETECQRALGMQSKEIADAQISASSTYNLHKPFYGRMNLASFGGDPARTAWCAVKDDRSPYFEIQLPEMTSLTGVATQGLSLFDNWVTSYLFCYSDDREFWECYKEKGYDKVFEANTDKNSIKRHHFHHAVDAKYVRIRPQSWYGNHLCMRVEIYGCTMDLIPDIFDSFGSLPVFMEDTEAQTRNEIAPKESCNKPLGVSNGEVDDIHLSASSSLDDHDQPMNGRLVRESIDQSDVIGCWCARDVNLRQYIEADLGEVKTITGIATQGYVSHDNWVVSYRLGYSDDANALEWYRENDDERLFDGNTDRSSIVKHFLKRPIQARYVRLNPRAWHGIHICMRFEIFGCKEAPDMAVARLTIDDETQEFSEVPAHHSAADFLEQIHRLKPPSHRAEIYPDKKPVAEENAEDKHFIPKKESIHSSYHLLEEKLNNEGPDAGYSIQKKAHEIKRIKPGHASRAMLRISYPEPQIYMPKHSENPTNRTIPSNINTKPNFSLNQSSEKSKNHIIDEINKIKTNQANSKLGSKQNELEMLKIVDKLQDLSDDKLAQEMKGPILALAKEKILEDLTGIKQNKKISGDDCKRTGVCSSNKIPTPAAKPTPPPAIQQLLSQNNLILAFQNQQQQRQRQRQQQQQLQQAFIGSQQRQPTSDSNRLFNNMFSSMSQFGSPNFLDGKTDVNHPAERLLTSNSYLSNTHPPVQPTIDAAGILRTYPELKANGITEAVLTMLSARVPNLQERIEKHFATKNRALAERNKKLSEANNAFYSSPNFMKHFKEYLQGPSGDLSGPQKDGINRIEPTLGQSSLVKPPGIDEHPCRRDGTCVFPDALYHKPPHALAPKPDVWIKDAFLLPTGVKDDTRLTPDSMILQGPDPRYLDYYKSYIEGHPGVYLPPTTPPPTVPPPPPSIQPPPYVELSTTIEGLPPGSSVTSEVTTFEWTPYSVCSVTCGRGEKKRFRRCSEQDCPSGGVEIETIICIQPDCPEIDPYNWSEFTTCSASCGTGLSSRYRLCTQDNCAADGYETEQITCSQPACPVCLLDFEVIENHVVIDQSGWGNHGYLDQNVGIREHPQICGHYADMTTMGEVLLSAQTFLGKPKTGITIACWVNIQGDITGKHSIFSTIRRTVDNSYIGGYHLEINGGAVRWFHRDEHSRTIYSMLTGPVAIPRVWMHYTVIYDAVRGFARVYVDGKEQGTALGSGMLAEDWGYKASIGSYDFDERRLNGWIDEFIMYDYALNEDQIFHLLGKMRCPTGKSTTIEIDAFKFETMTLNGGTKKRSIIGKNSISSEILNNLMKKKFDSKDSFTSKINTKYKRGLNDSMTSFIGFPINSKHSNASAQTLVERMLTTMNEKLQSQQQHVMKFKKPHR